MGDRDRQILLLIEFLADDYIASRFQLPEFCDRLESLIDELENQKLRDAFSAPVTALREVCEIARSGIHQAADMRLEAWAIKRTRRIAHDFVALRAYV